MLAPAALDELEPVEEDEFDVLVLLSSLLQAAAMTAITSKAATAQTLFVVCMPRNLGKQG